MSSVNGIGGPPEAPVQQHAGSIVPNDPSVLAKTPVDAIHGSPNSNELRPALMVLQQDVLHVGLAGRVDARGFRAISRKYVGLFVVGVGGQLSSLVNQSEINRWRALRNGRMVSGWTIPTGLMQNRTT